ncbi:MAG TPA: hypothetical protein VFZ08_13755 [Terriglobia bacterium]|nr:hypothetical protein [Terriglobia bacterium]
MAALCVVVVCSFLFLCARRVSARSRITVIERRVIHLRGALPHVLQVVLLPGGQLAVFSRRADQDYVSLGIFSGGGVLVKNLAGTSVATGLGRLTCLQVDSHGTLWVTALIPAEIVRFNQDHLLSVNILPTPMLAYALALDETRGYAYITGCARERRGSRVECLLVHQFTINGMKFRRSFLDSDPGVLRNEQFGIQWVPIDVDSAGTVWAVDSPAFNLYSIEPASGRITSYPIRSRIAKPAGKLNPLEGPVYTHAYYEASFIPNSLIAVGHVVIVGIRCPDEAGNLLEIFSSNGRQIDMDIPAPGRLVGKYGKAGLLFGRSGKKGPVLIEGALSSLR